MGMKQKRWGLWKFDRIALCCLKFQLLVISTAAHKYDDSKNLTYRNDSVPSRVSSSNETLHPQKESNPSGYAIHPNVTITSVVIPYDEWIKWPEEKLKQASSSTLKNGSVLFHLEGATTESAQTKAKLNEFRESVHTVQAEKNSSGKEVVHDVTTQMNVSSHTDNVTNSMLGKPTKKPSQEVNNLTFQKDVSSINSTTSYVNETYDIQELTTKNYSLVHTRNESDSELTKIIDNSTHLINESYASTNVSDSSAHAMNVSKADSSKITSSSLVHHSSEPKAAEVKAYEPVPIEDGPFGSLIWRDKRYLMSVLIPIGVGIAGAIIIITMGYIVKYCPRPQPLRILVRPPQETQVEQTTSMSSADRMVLLMDSSDDEF